MRYINDIKKEDIKLHNIAFAWTSPSWYEMSRIIALQHIDLLDASKGEILLIVEGEHCSCYDFDESTWSGTAYTRPELISLANAPYNEKSEFWQMIKNHYKG